MCRSFLHHFVLLSKTAPSYNHHGLLESSFNADYPLSGSQSAVFLLLSAQPKSSRWHIHSQKCNHQWNSNHADNLLPNGIPWNNYRRWQHSINYGIDYDWDHSPKLSDQSDSDLLDSFEGDKEKTVEVLHKELKDPNVEETRCNWRKSKKQRQNGREKTTESTTECQCRLRPIWDTRHQLRPRLR